MSWLGTVTHAPSVVKCSAQGSGVAVGVRSGVGEGVAVGDGEGVGLAVGEGEGVAVGLTVVFCVVAAVGLVLCPGSASAEQPASIARINGAVSARVTFCLVMNDAPIMNDCVDYDACNGPVVPMQNIGLHRNTCQPCFLIGIFTPDQYIYTQWNINSDERGNDLKFEQYLVKGSL